jgi:hypothetical protein
MPLLASSTIIQSILFIFAKHDLNLVPSNAMGRNGSV